MRQLEEISTIEKPTSKNPFAGECEQPGAPSVNSLLVCVLGAPCMCHMCETYPPKITVDVRAWTSPRSKTNHLLHLSLHTYLSSTLSDCPSWLQSRGAAA